MTDTAVELEELKVKVTKLREYIKELHAWCDAHEHWQNRALRAEDEVADLRRELWHG